MTRWKSLMSFSLAPRSSSSSLTGHWRPGPNRWPKKALTHLNNNACSTSLLGGGRQTTVPFPSKVRLGGHDRLHVGPRQPHQARPFWLYDDRLVLSQVVRRTKKAILR